ncbi:MAG: hypothetical protein KDD67_12140 [Ignavibacteriae bacterium]|nr:hypothetical protein [Ignavibacteriota bacterium]MCB9217236.1 hypothetical protein [Ignavibacteria bacterium]
MISIHSNSRLSVGRVTRDQDKKRLEAVFPLLTFYSTPMNRGVNESYSVLTINNERIPRDAGSLLWSYALGWLPLPGASAPGYQPFAALRLFGNDFTSRSDRRLVASCASTRNPTAPLLWSTSGASLLGIGIVNTVYSDTIWFYSFTSTYIQELQLQVFHHFRHDVWRNFKSSFLMFWVHIEGEQVLILYNEI